MPCPLSAAPGSAISGGLPGCRARIPEICRDRCQPLLDFSGLPRFEAIRPEHVAPALDVLLAEAEAAVSAAEQVQPVRWETFVTPLDDATERLWRAWGLVGHLQGVVNTPNCARPTTATCRG